MTSKELKKRLKSSVSVEELASVITPEQVTDLIRCGVHWCSDADSLAMLV